MTNRAQILLTSAHTAVYRLTRGRIGGRLGSLEQVLLTTRGRTSGKDRTTPLVGVRQGDRVLLVASNGGAAAHPAWYLNLVADPHVQVQAGALIAPMLARPADDAERPALWAVVTAANSSFRGYQAKTDRIIPVVICTPCTQ